MQLIQDNYDLRTGDFPSSDHVTASSVTSELPCTVPLFSVSEEAAMAETTAEHRATGKS